MSSEYGGTIEFFYETDTRERGVLSRSDILASALADWQVFTGNPEETLPWNTSMRVSVDAEGNWFATVLIRWERVS